MKNYSLLFNVIAVSFALSFLSCNNEENQAETVYFEDQNFKETLLNEYPSLDTNADGVISPEEAESLTGFLNLSQKEIRNFEGLQYFVNIDSLDISHNTSANIHVEDIIGLKYLKCVSVGLKTLDITQNTALEELIINVNWLEALDTSQNLNLKKLNCSSNKITAYDFSKNANLEEVDLSLGKAEEIDLSFNKKLKSVTILGGDMEKINLANGANDLITTLKIFADYFTCVKVDDASVQREGWSITSLSWFANSCDN